MNFLTDKLPGGAGLFTAVSFPQMRVEWFAAGVFSVIWLAALGTYGLGYFGTHSEPAFLEVVLYLSSIFFPLMCVWCAAWVFGQTNDVRADVAILKDVVARLSSSMEMADPATRSDVLEAIEAATSRAIRSEQLRTDSRFRNLSEENRKISEAVKTLLAARGQEHSVITEIAERTCELVETAQGVATKAAEKAEAADHVRVLSETRADTDDDQHPLPLSGMRGDNGAPAPAWHDIVRALDFPKNAHDGEGFAAIRKVIDARPMAQLMPLAEKMLGALADEGIYTEDLACLNADPALWVRFAAGERGAALSGIATIHDPTAEALIRGRMRNDQEFQETSLAFQQAFGAVLETYIDKATDLNLVALADSRTGRAFQVMARVTGTFG